MIIVSAIRMVQGAAVHTRRISTMCTYEDAVKALNGLQSNAAYLRTVRNDDYRSRNVVEDTKKYLIRSGISLEKLETLSVIHIGGTKGKGSACAFTESLLRSHGVKTGLYTSPHLISVRERLRINGIPIDRKLFATYFWKVYRTLEKEREFDGDMPQYFKFLTLLMFHIFLDTSVDVAIIEVGIGGEHDCTNIVPRPVCVGITSLGLDHTRLLGNTLESIAYQKSGIFKSGTKAFTVPQPIEAMRILEKRSRDKQCSLSVVPAFENYPWPNGKPILGIAGDFQSYNASVALNMASEWLERNTGKYKKLSLNSTVVSALSSCRWPGRTQLLRGTTIDFYLDGAHTFESMECCVSWFGKSTKNCGGSRFLVFNTTGDRNSFDLLTILRSLNFEKAFFVPNIAGKHSTIDQINYNVSNDEQMRGCRKNCNFWGQNAVCASSVSEVLDHITNNTSSTDERMKVLVTGSLHLVGATLAILDPDLTLNTKY